MLTLALASLALGPAIYAAATPFGPAAAALPSLTGTITKVDLAHHVVVVKVTKGAARYKGKAVTLTLRAAPPGGTAVTRLGHAGRLVGLRRNDRVVVTYKVNAAKKPIAVHIYDSGPPPTSPTSPSPMPTPKPTPSATATTSVPYSPSPGSPTTSTSPSPADPNTIHLSNFQYTPNVLTVPVGTTVHIVIDHGIHTWTEGTYGSPTSGGFDSAGASTYQFTFNTPGDYPFFCSYHGGAPYYMTGTIHVTAS